MVVCLSKSWCCILTLRPLLLAWDNLHQNATQGLSNHNEHSKAQDELARYLRSHPLGKQFKNDQHVVSDSQL